MQVVDENAPIATNSDAAMWREDHESAIRYIEALLAERERWWPVIDAARGLSSDDWEILDNVFEWVLWWGGAAPNICHAISVALKENANG